MCDIDHFKVNDTWGHHLGDDVLYNSPIFCAAEERPQVYGRGGISACPPDESGAITWRNTPRSARDRGDASEDENEIPITVSIGVSCAKGKSGVDAILGLADAALYSAKGLGRNRVVFAGGENAGEAGAACCPRPE